MSWLIEADTNYNLRTIKDLEDILNKRAKGYEYKEKEITEFKTIDKTTITKVVEKTKVLHPNVQAAVRILETLDKKKWLQGYEGGTDDSEIETLDFEFEELAPDEN